MPAPRRRSALALGGPLLLAASVSMTSFALSASKGLVAGMPGALGLVLDVIQYFMLAAGTAALYQYVPNTSVKWSHAWAGGLFSLLVILTWWRALSPSR